MSPANPTAMLLFPVLDTGYINGLSAFCILLGWSLLLFYRLPFFVRHDGPQAFMCRSFFDSRTTSGRSASSTKRTRPASTRSSSKTSTSHQATTHSTAHTVVHCRGRALLSRAVGLLRSLVMICILFRLRLSLLRISVSPLRRRSKVHLFPLPAPPRLRARNLALRTRIYELSIHSFPANILGSS
ncbi:hypothetical protein C8R45DRAFT_60815 [Mycena sanguinolenta]|nr:hypothetical protein C8R45DRAFT_60815 [Mycena sanguinolenta]